MDPITVATIALTLIATKATEKVGESLGEGVISSTKKLLRILKQKSPETLKRLESKTDNPYVIDAKIVEEVQRVAEAEPEVKEALNATAKAIQAQFGSVINEGKLAEKIGFVFQGGYNPVKIEKFELCLESSGREPTESRTPLINTSLFQAPADLRDFSGYTVEVEQVVGVFHDNQESGCICGVWGMGGVGKTSFATHIAHKLKAFFPDGVIWIDMYGMRENPTTYQFAMRYVVNSFYPNEHITKDISLLTGRYRSVLNSKKVLIVLDDILDAEQIELLIPPSPCSLLITSRTQLVLDSCISFQLCCFEESVANNFVKYLAGNNRLTDAQAHTISELCGNLPLALRVAGSYLKNYADDPNVYICQLRNERTKLDILKVQNKNVEAVLSLSARRLIQEDEELANLWQSLSVCEGLFTLYHVEHIVDPVNAGDYTMVRLAFKNIHKNESQLINSCQNFTNREEDNKSNQRIKLIVKEEQERFHGKLQEISCEPQKIQDLVTNSYKIQHQLEFLAERSLISRKKGEDEPSYYIHELMRPIARQVFNYGGSKMQKKPTKFKTKYGCSKPC